MTIDIALTFNLYHNWCDSSSRGCFILTVCGFEAFINGKHIIGEVKEKEQAHKEYKKAISEGHGAYLMDEETPVSNSWSTSKYFHSNF